MQDQPAAPLYWRQPSLTGGLGVRLGPSLWRKLLRWRMMGSVDRPLEERISVQHVSAHRPASSHKLVALGVAGLAGTIVYPYAVMAVQLLQHGDGSSQAVSQLVHGRDGVAVAPATALRSLS